MILFRLPNQIPSNPINKRLIEEGSGVTGPIEQTLLSKLGISHAFFVALEVSSLGTEDLSQFRLAGGEGAELFHDNLNFSGIQFFDQLLGPTLTRFVIGGKQLACHIPDV